MTEKNITNTNEGNTESVDVTEAANEVSKEAPVDKNPVIAEKETKRVTSEDAPEKSPTESKQAGKTAKGKKENLSAEVLQPEVEKADAVSTPKEDTPRAEKADPDVSSEKEAPTKDSGKDKSLA